MNTTSNIVADMGDGDPTAPGRDPLETIVATLNERLARYQKRLAVSSAAPNSSLTFAVSSPVNLVAATTAGSGDDQRHTQALMGASVFSAPDDEVVHLMDKGSPIAIQAHGPLYWEERSLFVSAEELCCHLNGGVNYRIICQQYQVVLDALLTMLQADVALCRNVEVLPAGTTASIMDRVCNLVKESKQLLQECGVMPPPALPSHITPAHTADPFAETNIRTKPPASLRSEDLEVQPVDSVMSPRINHPLPSPIFVLADEDGNGSTSVHRLATSSAHTVYPAEHNIQPHRPYPATVRGASESAAHSSPTCGGILHRSLTSSIVKSSDKIGLINCVGLRGDGPTAEDFPLPPSSQHPACKERVLGQAPEPNLDVQIPPLSAPRSGPTMLYHPVNGVDVAKNPATLPPYMFESRPHTRLPVASVAGSTNQVVTRDERWQRLQALYSEDYHRRGDEMIKDVLSLVFQHEYDQGAHCSPDASFRSFKNDMVGRVLPVLDTYTSLQLATSDSTPLRGVYLMRCLFQRAKPLPAVLERLKDLEVRNVETLSLSNFKMGESGMWAILGLAHRLYRLRYLDLSKNQLHDDCIPCALVVLQHHPALETVNLSKNNITDASLGILVEMVQTTPHLRAIMLQGCPFSDASLAVLDEEIRRCRSTQKSVTSDMPLVAEVPEGTATRRPVSAGVVPPSPPVDLSTPGVRLQQLVGDDGSVTDHKSRVASTELNGSAPVLLPSIEGHRRSLGSGSGMTDRRTNPPNRPSSNPSASSPFHRQRKL